MSTLLHVQSSPRGPHSTSIAVAERFIEVYCARHPEDTVETLNVWETDLPEFDGATIDAKYAVLHGQTQTPAQIEAWQAVARIADRFKSADKYLFSLPMWNFGLPYKLKHFIDVMVQPGLAFTYSPEAGYKGLIVERPVVAIYTRGGAFGPGTGAESSDAQSPHLRQILGLIGFTDIKDVFVEPTLGEPALKGAAVAAAKTRAAELAAAF